MNGQPKGSKEPGQDQSTREERAKETEARKKRAQTNTGAQGQGPWGPVPKVVWPCGPRPGPGAKGPGPRPGARAPSGPRARARGPGPWTGAAARCRILTLWGESAKINQKSKCTFPLIHRWGGINTLL